MIAAVLGFLVLPAVSALAAGGGGSIAGNNGVALDCPGQPLSLVDVALPENEALPLALPESWPELVIRVRESGALLGNANLAERILETLELFGPSEQWETGPGARAFDDYLPTPVPPGCTIVPVSTMNPAEGRIRPRRASAYERLGARQRRVLELHEAVYSVGIRFYRHTHAVSARALVHLLLALDPPASEVQAAVREFVHAGPKPGPAGSFVLSGNPRGQEACPKYVDITPVGGRGWHVVIGAYSWEQYANRYEGVPASSQNASLRIREFQEVGGRWFATARRWSLIHDPARLSLTVTGPTGTCAYSAGGIPAEVIGGYPGLPF